MPALPLLAVLVFFVSVLCSIRAAFTARGGCAGLSVLCVLGADAASTTAAAAVAAAATPAAVSIAFAIAAHTAAGTVTPG